jgi:hypothetical protein
VPHIGPGVAFQKKKKKKKIKKKKLKNKKQTREHIMIFIVKCSTHKACLKMRKLLRSDPPSVVIMVHVLIQKENVKLHVDWDPGKLNQNKLKLGIGSYYFVDRISFYCILLYLTV